MAAPANLYSRLNYPETLDALVKRTYRNKPEFTQLLAHLELVADAERTNEAAQEVFIALSHLTLNRRRNRFEAYLFALLATKPRETAKEVEALFQDPFCGVNQFCYIPAHFEKVLGKCPLTPLEPPFVHAHFDHIPPDPAPCVLL